MTAYAYKLKILLLIIFFPKKTSDP